MGGRPGQPQPSSRLPLSLTLTFLSGKHGRLIIALPAHSAHSFLLLPYCSFQLPRFNKAVYRPVTTQALLATLF